MLVPEIEQDHAEKIRCLAMIQTPKSNFGSKVTQRLAQFLRSRPSVILTSMESRFRFPSTSGNNTNSWFVISRGPNRSVDELRYKDPEYSPESFEDADYGSTEETHAGQSTTQLRSQCRQLEDPILLDKRECIVLTSLQMNIVLNTCSKPVSRNLS